MMNWLFAILLLAGFAFVAWRVAKEKGWQLPAGVAAFGAGIAYWFRDIADKVTGWF